MNDQRRWFRAVLEQVSDGVVHATADGEISFVNEAARAIFELDQLADKARAAHASLLHDPSMFNAEDGGVYLTVLPLLDAQGTLDSFVMIMRDDRERVLLQGQLDQAARMASLGVMAASIAHEINNPLAFISANVEYTGTELRVLVAEMEQIAARLGATKTEQKSGAIGTLTEMTDAISDTRVGTSRLRRIVEDLRIFSHPDPKLTALDPRTEVELAIRICTPKARARALIETKIEPTARVFAEEGKLAQVLINLISNAIDAIPEGRADQNRVTVSVDSMASGDVRIRVTDTGHGMNDDTKARLFLPFFTTKASGSGTGLGLSIVKRLVGELRGEIAVQSEIGKGTTFSLLLPPCADTEAAVEVRPSKRLARRPRLLILDDEPLILVALKRLLSRDYEVVDLQNPLEALNRIKSGERFDILLCDLIMPEMSGWDLFEELRRIAPDQAHSCVFLTGASLHSQARRFLEGVENRRLEKPFDAESLERELREILERQTIGSG